MPDFRSTLLPTCPLDVYDAGTTVLVLYTIWYDSVADSGCFVHGEGECACVCGDQLFGRKGKWRPVTRQIMSQGTPVSSRPDPDRWSWVSEGWERDCFLANNYTLLQSQPLTRKDNGVDAWSNGTARGIREEVIGEWAFDAVIARSQDARNFSAADSWMRRFTRLISV